MTACGVGVTKCNYGTEQEPQRTRPVIEVAEMSNKAWPLDFNYF